MFTNSKIAKAVKLATIMSVASAGFVATQATAQDSQADETVEKISVTGSRIRSASLIQLHLYKY